MRFHYGAPVKSRWLSVRGIAKITLALVAFVYFFGFSRFPFTSRSASTSFNDQPASPRSPLQSGLSSSALDRFHSTSSEQKVSNEPAGVDDAEAAHLEALAREEEERKRKEEEKLHKEEEKRKQEEDEQRRREKKEEEERQRKEEEAKQRKQKEEARLKEEENEQPEAPEDQEKTTSDTTVVENSDISKPEADPPEQGPKNLNKLTTTIVAGRMKKEVDNVKWMDELKDINHKRIYVVDDTTAELHLSQNKGRESMVYIRYILDHYDNLDDVTIFTHPSRSTWHNNVLHKLDGAIMFNNLQRSWIVKQGYMNVRCELYPGCPQWIKWNATKFENDLHPERLADVFDAKLWDYLFPDRTHDPVFLSQPCCSQFAASKDAIRSIPKEQYQKIHDWLGTTETSDSIAGRVMEYAWQYLFLGKEEHCPDMIECYCKGYGLCLTDEAHKKDLIRYNRLRSEIDDTLEKLDQWDRARGCHDMPKSTPPEERRACKKPNPWGTPLTQVRAEKEKLERDMPMLFGVTKP